MCPPGFFILEKIGSYLEIVRDYFCEAGYVVQTLLQDIFDNRIVYFFIIMRDHIAEAGHFSHFAFVKLCFTNC